jgi:hypothetical protein
MGAFWADCIVFSPVGFHMGSLWADEKSIAQQRLKWVSDGLHHKIKTI